MFATAFAGDAELFQIAVANYKFLVTKCGSTNTSLRPVGLPASIDVATFDPTRITPEIIQQHPGLMMPSIEYVKDIPGQDFAADRYLVLARFKHAWQKVGDVPYWYVDRFVARREKGVIKLAEYEFTADQNDFAPHPTLLSTCPQ